LAIFLNNKVGFKIATVDLSDHVTAFTLNRMRDQISVTSMGDTANKFVTGLSSDTITVTFLNDTAAGSVLATLQDAYGTTVAFSAVQVTGSPTVISATNKLYTGTILIDSIPDISGTPADEATIDLTFTCNSTTVVASTGTF
jgi:hypothetical protein